MTQYSFPIPFLSETNHPGWSRDIVEWVCDKCSFQSANKDEIIEHIRDSHSVGIIWPVFSKAGKNLLVNAWSLLYGADATRTILNLLTPRGQLKVLENLGVKPEWVEEKRTCKADTHLAYWAGVGNDQSKRSSIYSSDESYNPLIRFPRGQVSDIEAPLRELRTLLDVQSNDESEYQKLLIQYPWAFSAQYTEIERHTQLDDKNIPDFTGKRVRDDYRDIFEIKPPFTKMFRDTGGFTADFNDAWNQAERYLDFARTERDYLGRKGLLFDNPECYLILGFRFSEDQIKKIRTKERMNPAIRLITYDNLLTFVEKTITFIQDVYDSDRSKF